MAALPLWIVAALTGVEAVSCVAAFVGTILVMQWFWGMLQQPASIVHLLALGCVSLTAILNIGYLMAWSAATFQLGDPFPLILDQLDTTITAYAIAVSYALLFASVLGAIGLNSNLRRIERKLAVKLRKISNEQTIVLVMVLLVGMVFDVAVIQSGAIGFRDVNLGVYERGRVSELRVFLEIALLIQIFCNAALIPRCFERPRIRWQLLFFVAISTASIWFVYFNKGRGQFVLAIALTFLFGCLVAGRRPPVRWLVGLGIAAVIVLPSAISLSQGMRNQKFAGVGESNVTAFQIADRALDSYTGNYRVRELSAKKSAENLAKRPLVAGVLANCIALDSNAKSYLMGKVILSNFVWAIPRVIFPWKVLMPFQEGQIYQAFPHPAFLKDAADSSYLYAYVEFGWVGWLIFPFLLALIWVVGLLLMLIPGRSVLVWILFCSWPFLFLLGIGESTLTTWFVTLRNTLMFLPLVIIIDKMFAGGKPRRVTAKRRGREARSTN